MADEFVVLLLHGKLEPEEQQEVFKEHAFDTGGIKMIKTKIILSTKIAECSLTIDGVRIVIDSGKDKDACYDPIKKMTVLENTYISQSAAN